jgi:hypothetical protein
MRLSIYYLVENALEPTLCDSLSLFSALRKNISKKVGSQYSHIIRPCRRCVLPSEAMMQQSGASARIPRTSEILISQSQ